MAETMTSYHACELAEGFGSGEGASEAEQLKAWAYLIKTGQCWTLQGWYGRNAKALIDADIISKDGKIAKHVIRRMK